MLRRIFDEVAKAVRLVLQEVSAMRPRRDGGAWARRSVKNIMVSRVERPDATELVAQYHCGHYSRALMPDLEVIALPRRMLPALVRNYVKTQCVICGENA